MPKGGIHNVWIQKIGFGSGSCLDPTFELQKNVVSIRKIPVLVLQQQVAFFLRIIFFLDNLMRRDSKPFIKNLKSVLV